MNRYHLVHVTEFRYDGPVSESYNEARLRPLDDEKQSCLSFRLTVSPSAHSSSYQDSFGNWVYQFHVLAEHRHLRVVVESSVLTLDFPPAAPSEMTLSELDAQRNEICEEYFDFVAPTAFVPHLPEIRPFVEEAEKLGGNTVTGFIEAAARLIHQRFRYVKGSTHVHSSIEDSLARGEGVCQDFTHLLLGLTRMRGLPARYVSGYLVPESAAEPGNLQQVIGGQASHAWAEVFVPSAGWIGLDPTLGAPVGPRHVRVAYGRDYNDVAPLRGVYKGHAGQRLWVDVCVCPSLDSQGHEQLEETAAAPVDSAIVERPQQPAQQQQ
jgi:transglutaminase-like putative cysteine protease